MNDEIDYRTGVWYEADIKPKPIDDCVLALEDHGGFITFDFGFYANGKWHTLLCDSRDYKVAYWMLIPEVPRKE